MKKWEFAIKDINEVRKKGLLAEYIILVDGVAMYTELNKDCYINKGYTILSDSAFDDLIKEHERSICNHWHEISESSYHEMLNILPPINYSWGGFYISEATTGSIYDFYQEYHGKFYTSLQDIFTDRQTVIENLIKAIANNQIESRK